MSKPRFDNYSKTALVGMILVRDDQIEALQGTVANFERLVANFTKASVFVRLWRALRGRIA